MRSDPPQAHRMFVWRPLAESPPHPPDRVFAGRGIFGSLPGRGKRGQVGQGPRPPTGPCLACWLDSPGTTGHSVPENQTSGWFAGFGRLPERSWVMGRTYKHQRFRRHVLEPLDSGGKVYRIGGFRGPGRPRLFIDRGRQGKRLRHRRAGRSAGAEVLGTLGPLVLRDGGSSAGRYDGTHTRKGK